MLGRGTTATPLPCDVSTMVACVEYVQVVLNCTTALYVEVEEWAKWIRYSLNCTECAVVHHCWQIEMLITIPNPVCRDLITGQYVVTFLLILILCVCILLRV
jgi:hypothetical protein